MKTITRRIDPTNPTRRFYESKNRALCIPFGPERKRKAPLASVLPVPYDVWCRYDRTRAALVLLDWRKGQ